MRPTENALVANGRGSLASFPLKLVDLGILAVIFIAPLFMGGRGPVGKFVLITIVCLTAVAWAVGQCRRSNGCWRRSGVEWLLLAAILLVVLQLAPLPGWMLGRVSPAIPELLPLWSSTGSATVAFGEWSTVALTPEATRGGLMMLLCYSMLFLLVVQRVQSIDDVANMLRWIAIGIIFMAVLGIVQFLFGNGKFLWFFEHPSRDTFLRVKGSFHNQNHFAHFLALGVGPLIWTWTKAAPGSLKKHMYGIGLGLVLVAGLLTASRGGVISIGVAGLTTVVILYCQSLINKQALVVGAAMAAIVAVAILIHGYEPLSSKFGLWIEESRSLQAAAGERTVLWSAMMDGFQEFMWLGSGIGSHRDVYPLFMEEHYDAEFTHGENGFLQLALEGGIAASLLMLSGIGICFWWCFGALKRSASTAGHERKRAAPNRPTFGRAKADRGELVSCAACAGAVLPGLIASLVHSLGDFVWYISACMSVTLLLIACACRLHQLARPAQGHGDAPAVPRDELRLSRPTWIGITVILVIMSSHLIHDRHHAAWAAPHWHAYRRIAMPTYRGTLPEEAIERDQLFEMAGHLKRALDHDPGDPRMNLRFAATCLRRFELEQRHATNPMALQQIREAAFASRFASKEAQDAWLNLAIGENMRLLDLALQHCHRALRNGPLQGEGYVYLADLSFLESPHAEAKDAYIDQAYRVRPHDSVVTFAMGQERALAGDLDGALQHWRGAFQRDAKIRSLIIEQFSPNVPGEFFVEHFQPDTAALRQLKQNYQRVGQTADAQFVARQLVIALGDETTSRDQADAANAWFELQAVHAFLGDRAAALQSVRRAVELDADNVEYRVALGTYLLESEDYSGAARELEWCRRRKPDDPTILAKLTVANRGLVERSAKSLPTGTRL